MNTVTVNGQTYTQYAVQPADTGLMQIARDQLHDYTLYTKIMRWNNGRAEVIQNTEYFRKDWTLLLPPAGSPVQPPVVHPEQYTVNSGDTIYSVAQAHGVNVDDIFRANPGLTVYDFVHQADLYLPVGRVITMPKKQ